MASEAVGQAQTAESLPEDQMTAAFSGPAPLINKIVVTLTPTTARIAFLEFPPTGVGPNLRSAVSMSIGDLVALQTLLNRLLTENQVVANELKIGQSDAPR